MIWSQASEAALPSSVWHLGHPIHHHHSLPELQVFLVGDIMKPTYMWQSFYQKKKCLGDSSFNDQLFPSTSKSRGSDTSRTPGSSSSSSWKSCPASTSSCIQVLSWESPRKPYSLKTNNLFAPHSSESNKDRFRGAFRWAAMASTVPIPCYVVYSFPGACSLVCTKKWKAVLSMPEESKQHEQHF